MSQEYASLYELAALSWGSVGKSAVIHRFVSDQFVDVWDPTIEDKYHKTIQLGGKEVSLDILDTNGHEEYVALLDGWIRSSQGFLLMYDIGRRSSYDQIERLYQLILTNKNSSVEPAVLVGNCCDREYTRVVSKEEGLRLAERLRIPFFETSALTGENVNQVFLELVESITSSTGPALRRHKQELKHLSTWNIKRRRELVKQIKKLEIMQAGVEKAGQLTRRRSVVTSPVIQVRPSTLVADIGKLFDSSELQPFDLCFVTTKETTEDPPSGPTSPSKASPTLKKTGSIRHRASLFKTFSVDSGSESNSPSLSPTVSNEALSVITNRLSASLSLSTPAENRVYCHKTIAMLRCPGLLKKNKKETKWNEELKIEEVTLPDWIDSVTLRNLLQFAYTGSVGVSSRQEAVLLKFLGSYCKFSDVVNSCDKLLDSDLSFIDLCLQPTPLTPPPTSSPISPDHSPLSSWPPATSSPSLLSSSFTSSSSPSPLLQAAVISASLPSSPVGNGHTVSHRALDRRERDSGKRKLFYSIGKGRGKSKLRESESPLQEMRSEGEEAPEKPRKILVQAGLKSYFDSFRQLLSPLFAPLSDICFMVEGKAFHLHRLVLVSRSTYFRTFFRYESGPGPHEFNWVSSVTFQQVTEFMYTGMVENLELEHAGPLLVAADMLNLEGLIDICESMMGTWVSNVENPIDVIELLQDSKSFGAQQLRNACIEKLAACYQLICDSQEFLGLDAETKALVMSSRKFPSIVPSRNASSPSSSSSRSSSPQTISSFFVDSTATSAFSSRRNTF